MRVTYPQRDRAILNLNFPSTIPRPGDGSSTRKLQFIKSQVAFALKQADDVTQVAELCSDGEATFYNWRKRCAGLMPPGVKRLR